MDRLFLDANVLFSAAYRHDAGLLKFWALKKAIQLSSRYAFEEARMNLTDRAQQRRLERLIRKVQLFEGERRPLPRSIRLPEKDAPILLAAIDLRATHLITGDARHFGPYFGKTIEGVRIISPADYLLKRTHS